MSEPASSVEGAARSGSGGAASTVEGAVAGYRPGATLSFRTEARRQLTRRRTQIALGLLAVLPLILIAAFAIGGDRGRGDQGEGGAFSTLADVATGGAANFALFTVFVSSNFLLVVVFALFFGDTVASEASWGSLRYLLAVPVPRARLLGVKATVSLAYAVGALVLLTGAALLAGTIAYGWHPMSPPVGGEISAWAAVLRLAGVVAYMAVQLMITGSLAFLLSVLTDAPLGAVGGAVLLTIISNILNAVTALGDLRNYLPTKYATAWLGLLSSPIDTEDMVRGGISVLIYGTLFFSLAWWRFTRKDVVS